MRLSKIQCVSKYFIAVVFAIESLCVFNASLAFAGNVANSTGIIDYKKPILKEIKPAKGKVIHVTSGTGFFVSNNAIVTNEHVVNGCKHIRIRGAVEPGYAELVSIDKKNDLALLTTSRSPRVYAPLRGDIPIEIGEEVNVMGYPLDRGIKGDYLIRKAVITNNNDVYEGIERIQFTDSVEKGNSGGPLLDTNGTVIGVIVGKMNYYLADSDDDAKPIKTSSVAITLEHLKSFLDKNQIYYRTDSTIYKFADSYMENKAKDYIVNIQCVKDDVEGGAEL